MTRKLKKHERQSLKNPRNRPELRRRCEPGECSRTQLSGGRLQKASGPTRKPGRSVLVVTEGETECNYFNAFKMEYRLPSLHVACPPCTDPVGLVRSAIAARNGQIPYDSVWVVCDSEEEHNPRRKQLNVARGIAARQNISFAVSTPCFEYFFLLHFTYTTQAFISPSVVEECLREKWKDYEKNCDIPPWMFEKLPAALRHAARCRRDKAIIEPATDVDLLIRDLLKMVPKK
ncbi:MAG: RloB family protein [Planctomycetes bacterium]|nr:RloB family protein [Planctomycetota bacterium]